MRIFSGLFILLCLAASAEPARGDGFSIQAGLNYARVDTVALGGHNLELDPPPTLRDTFSGASFRVGVAYALTDWASVELGYAQFASVDKYTAHFVEFACIPELCEGVEGSIVDNIDQSGHVQWAALIASRPYQRLNLFGKVGVGRTFIESVQASNRTNRIEERETQLLLGVGLAWPLSDRLGVRLEFERIGSTAIQAGASLAFAF